MPVIANLKVLISGVDNLSKQMSAPLKKMNAIGKKMMGIGAGFTAGVTLPIVAFGKSTLETAGNFEMAMNRVQNLTGATGESFKMLQDQAKLLGETTMFSASEAAAGMGFLGMAGFDTNAIYQAMPATLNLAAAAQMDLGETADIVSNILTGYNKSAEETGAVADVLVKGFQSSNTNLAQLGEAMSYVAPIAASMKVPFNETAAAIGMLSNAGIQGTRAGTSLRNALGALAKPSSEAIRVLQRLNINKKDILDAQGNVSDLRNVIEKFQKSGANAADFLTIFGKRAGPGMAAMVGQGVEAFDKLKIKLDEAGGAAQEAANVQMRGLNGQMKALKSAFEALQLAIADSGLLEFATKFITKLVGVTRWAAKTNPKLFKVATILAGLAAIVGPLVLIIGALVVAFTVIGGPILAITAAVAGVITAFTFLFVYWKEITGWLKNTWNKVWGAIPKPLQMAVKIMTAVLLPFISLTVLLIKNFEKIKNFGGKIFGGIKGFFGGEKDVEKGRVDGSAMLTKQIVQTNTNNSRFNGTLKIEGVPPKSQMQIEENGGLEIETTTGKLIPGVAY